MIAYNNNPFSYKGKLSRTAYIFSNLLLNLIGFNFLYYPGILAYLHSRPEFTTLLDQIAQNPENAWILPHLKYTPEVSALTIVIKLLFLVLFRIIDIKRMRDIRDQELRKIEVFFIAIFFSLPYVDFFSTLILSLLKPQKNSVQKDLVKEIRAKDLQEAKQESADELNTRLFKSGKISRAEFIANKKKAPH